MDISQMQLLPSPTGDGTEPPVGTVTIDASGLRRVDFCEECNHIAWLYHTQVEASWPTLLAFHTETLTAFLCSSCIEDLVELCSNSDKTLRIYKEGAAHWNNDSLKEIVLHPEAVLPETTETIVAEQATEVQPMAIIDWPNT